MTDMQYHRYVYRTTQRGLELIQRAAEIMGLLPPQFVRYAIVASYNSGHLPSMYTVFTEKSSRSLQYYEREGISCKEMLQEIGAKHGVSPRQAAVAAVMGMATDVVINNEAQSEQSA